VTATLVADCVAKRFGDRRVLSSATLRAMAGEVSALVGRNGIGKSTLLRIACGRLSADSGAVHFAGRSYLDVRHDRLAARGLFYLPVRGLFSRGLPIGVQLEMVRRQFGRVPAGDELGWLRLADVLGRRPDQLSGGELRRAELAMVFMRDPVCLLADEPFLGVAPKDGELLAVAFRTLAARGCAIVITGHEVPSLFAVASRVTWCTDGTTYELGEPALARTDARFRREYLGPGLN
jgi:ABC-type multidrug transport system ATPase subunit